MDTKAIRDALAEADAHGEDGELTKADWLIVENCKVWLQQLLDENDRSWKIAEDYKNKMVEANKKNYRMSHEIKQLQADKAVAVEALK